MMEDITKPLIDIPIPGPFFVLDIIPLTMIYAVVVYFDYFLYCQTSIPYQKYRNWQCLFHVSIPLIFSPKLHGLSTSFISISWFIASVGAYSSQLYKQKQLRNDSVQSEAQSFKAWIKSVGMEGLAESPDRQPNGITVTTKQVQIEGLKRLLMDMIAIALANIFLNPLLLDDPRTIFTFNWYSPQCIYYGVLMGAKGYTLLLVDDIIFATCQMVYGIRIMYIFDFPFLATSLKDFWGRRWNLVVRNIFRKQLYTDGRHKTMKDGKDKDKMMALKRLNAFFFSALMHETIMTLVNRSVTFEQSSFFLISGFTIYLQFVLPIPKTFIDNIPRFISTTLTLIFLAFTNKLFFGPFIRFEEQRLMFSKHSFI